MQLPIHVIAGILIQAMIQAIYPVSDIFQIILIGCFAFCSHFIIDPLALMTYHPPDPQPTRFWRYWHLFVYSAGIFLIIAFFTDYWFGMISANLVDIWDWLILRFIIAKKIKNDPNWGKNFYLHQIANRVRQPLIGRVPNLSYRHIGIVPELIVISIALFFGLMRVLSL